MTSPSRWTAGRVAVDAAIILIAVPVALEAIAPWPKGSGSCGMTNEFYSESLGLSILGIRSGFLALKWLNDFFEALLARPGDLKPEPKPQPLDDL